MLLPTFCIAPATGDEALALLPAQEATRRAEILVDRFWWRHVGEPKATAAVASVTDEVTAHTWRPSWPIPGCCSTWIPGPMTPRWLYIGFEAAGKGWGRVRLGAYTENVAGDPNTAAAHYAAVP